MKAHYPKRLIIYTKDIENITGQSNRSARRLLQEIRDHLGKSDDEYITIPEFCEYTGLTEEQIRPFLSG